MSDLKADLLNLTLYIKFNLHNEIKEVHYVEILRKIASIYKDIDTKLINEEELNERFESYNEDYIGDYN